MQEGITWNRVWIPAYQNAKENLQLSSSLYIRAVLGWIEASVVALLCCLSAERGAMARDVLYHEDSPYQQKQLSPERAVWTLCTAAGVCCPWSQLQLCLDSIRLEYPVPLWPSQQSVNPWGQCGSACSPRAARASLRWSLCCCCSPAGLKLSWLSQSMLEGSVSICKCKHDLWAVTGTLSYQQFWLNVALNHTLTWSDKYHCKMSGVLETLLYQKEVYSSTLLH